MKTQIILLAILLSQTSEARIQFSFFQLNRQAMIVTTDEPGDEPISEFLYQQMNVPPQDSFIGPGKSWSTPQKEFNMVCSLSPSQGNHCTFIVQNQKGAHLDPNKGVIIYTAEGTLAANILEKFILPAGQREFQYRSPDGQILIQATPTEFSFIGKKR